MGHYNGTAGPPLFAGVLKKSLRDRLMVGHMPLEHSILVRVQVPQHVKITMPEQESKIIYAYEKATDNSLSSIFLAGPSPRGEDNFNWRPEAIKKLQDLGFEGNIFVPLPRDGYWAEDYTDQVEWELEHLEKATVVVFWIPRDLKTLPAFTTNVEFGMFLKSGKIVLGSPVGAEKMKYLEYVARKNNVSVSNTLEETLQAGIDLVTKLKK